MEPVTRLERTHGLLRFRPVITGELIIEDAQRLQPVLQVPDISARGAQLERPGGCLRRRRSAKKADHERRCHE
ncbi:hypothetical protein D3C76_1639670 [compost metagenome]